VFAAAASALAYFGDHRLAQYLKTLFNVSEKSADPFKLLCDAVTSSPWRYTIVSKKGRKKWEKSDDETKQDTLRCCVRVVQVVADDNGIEHAVWFHEKCMESSDSQIRIDLI